MVLKEIRHFFCFDTQKIQKCIFFSAPFVCLYLFLSAGLSNRIFQTCSRIPFGVFIKLLVIYEEATPNNNLLFCLSVSVLKMAKCEKKNIFFVDFFSIKDHNSRWLASKLSQGTLSSSGRRNAKSKHRSSFNLPRKFQFPSISDNS